MKQMPRIKMMGIGHGGNHMLDYVMNQSIRNVEYITVADEETLLQSGAERSIQLDAEVMKCFYMDGHLNVKKIKPWITMELDKVLIGAEVLFIMAGMGGQVGSDIAPIVAQRAKELGIVTMALVTRPFSFEGKTRGEKADHGIEELQRYADEILVVPNEVLVSFMDKKMELKAGFQKINQFFYQKIHEKCHLLNAVGNQFISRDEMRMILQNQEESFEDFFLKNGQ